MYKYETHLHTAPVSRCAGASVKETLTFYKSMDYDGVFITNHFLDGNINISGSESYEKKIAFYFSDYEEAFKFGKEIGLKVFLGVEMTYRGTDFLIYGLGKEWFLSHPEIMEMPMTKKLSYIKESRGYVVHAHPYRDAVCSGHIRLYPHAVQAVEVINACRSDFENGMALHYAESYGFAKTAGSDNHFAGGCRRLAGVLCDTPINSEQDYIAQVSSGRIKLFSEAYESAK